MVRDWVEEKDAAATKESTTVPTGFGVPEAASQDAAAITRIRAR